MQQADVGLLHLRQHRLMQPRFTWRFRRDLEYMDQTVYSRMKECRRHDLEREDLISLLD